MKNYSKISQLNAPLFEGGDDAPAKQTKEQRKLDKYADQRAGLKHNDKLGNGSIVKDRGCTDVLCLGIFIAFLIAMGVVTYKGFTNGNVLKLLAPIDQNSLICGHDTTNSNGVTTDYAAGYKSLYITDLLSASPFESGWCVKECPSTKTEKIDFYTYPGKTIPSIEGGQYATKDFFGYCLPTNVKDLSAPQQAAYKAIKADLLNNEVGALFTNMSKAKDSIYIGMVFAIIWSILFIYLISAFAEHIAWGIVIITNVGLFAVGGLGVLEYH